MQVHIPGRTTADCINDIVLTADNVIDGEQYDDDGNLVYSDPQGWNRYAYVMGNPIVYKDPTGHYKGTDGSDLAGPEPAGSVSPSPLSSINLILNLGIKANEISNKIDKFQKERAGGYECGKNLNCLTVPWYLASPKGSGAIKNVVGNTSKVVSTTSNFKKVDIALGLTTTKTEVGVLVKFAKKVKAVSFGGWPSAGLTHGKSGHFKNQFFAAAKKARKIHFNLTGMGKTKDIYTKGKEGFQKLKNITNSEFYNIANNESLLKKTIFYDKGKNITKKVLKEISKIKE